MSKFLEGVSDQGNGDVRLIGPTKGLKKIEPDFYQIVVPEMRPAYLHKLHRHLDFLKNAQKSWDFDGQEAHARVEKDFNFWLNGAEEYKRLGLSHRRAVLTHGPPGTGKSVISQDIALKAIELGVPVVIPGSCNDLVSIKHVEVPIFIVLDEADSHGDDLAALLDVRHVGPRFYMMTTNELSSMHDRLKRRPGRIDRLYLVDRVPKGMLKNMLGKYGLGGAIDLVFEKYPKVTPAILAEAAIRHRMGLDQVDAVNEVCSEFY